MDECYRCGRDDAVYGSVVKGKFICSRCIPPALRCKKCDTGTLRSRPLPSWMNRWVCDTCNHKVSR